MDLKDIMLSEIIQSPKDKPCMISLNRVPRVVKLIETESGMVAKGWGWAAGMGNGSYCLMCTVSVLQDEDYGDGWW